jgi:hypothetical protein
MNQKQAESIRSLVVVLSAGQRQLRKLPRGKIKGRADSLRRIALEALDEVEQSISNCVEAYIEERFGIRYGSSVVIANLHTAEGPCKLTVRVMKCTLSEGDIPDSAQLLDRLHVEAWVHAPGEDRHDEGVDFVFNGSLGDTLLVVGEVGRDR